MLEPRYLRIPFGFSASLLDGEVADEERLAFLSIAADFSSYGSVGKSALEPRYFRMPLGLSAGILDGDTDPGKMLRLWRGAVDSECSGAFRHPVVVVKKCCIDFVPCR